MDKDFLQCDIMKPDYIIPMHTIPDNFAWYTWFKQNNLKGMTYGFYYLNKPIKFGCSYAAFETRINESFGERLIRQTKNLPGRAKIKPTDIYIEGHGFVPKSDNGRDMVQAVQLFEQKYNLKIDRDSIYLYIWNITDVISEYYYFHNDDEGNKKKAEYFEGILVEQYKRYNNNELPVGNKKDPSTQNKAYTEPKIAKEAGNLFIFS